MSKSGGTLYIGVPHSKFWGDVSPRPPKVYASSYRQNASGRCRQLRSEWMANNVNRNTGGSRGQSGHRTHPVCQSDLPQPVKTFAKRLVPPNRPCLQRADRNVAVGSHGQYVPTLTAAAAWRVNAAASKAAWWPWPLTFWPWKWCLSHMWRGLPLCQF